MDKLLQKQDEFREMNHKLKEIKKSISNDLKEIDFLSDKEKYAIKLSIKKARENNDTSFEIISEIGEKVKECYTGLSKRREYLKECLQLKRDIKRQRTEIKKQKQELSARLEAADSSTKKEIMDSISALRSKNIMVKKNKEELLEKIEGFKNEITNFKNALGMLEEKLAKQKELEEKIRKYLSVRIKFNKLKEEIRLLEEEDIVKNMLMKGTVVKDTDNIEDITANIVSIDYTENTEGYKDTETDTETVTDTDTDMNTFISNINNPETLTTKETNIEDIAIEEDTETDTTDTDEDMQALISNINNPEILTTKEVIAMKNEVVIKYNSSLKSFKKIKYIKIFSSIENIAAKLGKEQEEKIKKEVNQINVEVYKNIELILENLKVQKEIIDHQTEIITQKRKDYIELFSEQETKEFKENFAHLNELQSQYYELITNKDLQEEYLENFLHKLEENYIKAQIPQKQGQEDSAKFPLKKQFAIANAIAEDNFTSSLINDDDVDFDKK